MSRKSFDPEPIRAFLESFRGRGFSSENVYDTNLCIVMSEGEIYFRAGRTVLDGLGEIRASIALGMAPQIHPQTPSCYLVYMLKVVQIGRKYELLSGEEALRHYGRRLAQKRDYDVFPIPDDLWTVRRPSDVEALLVAYDHAAKLYSTPRRKMVTVFNLPN